MKQLIEESCDLKEIIAAVSVVVQIRDPYTAGHQRRVALLSRAIAREMELSEGQVERVHVSGLLHDVGKIVIPASILNKCGKIDRREYNIIQSHCRAGYEMLQKIDFPQTVTRAVLQHHERLDGSGYPLGLGGDDIALEARIIGVADVVEAISSKRPYRPALGLDYALVEVLQGYGTLYDKDVVDACLHLFRKNESDFAWLGQPAETAYAGVA